jgi:hypothetical protein
MGNAHVSASDTLLEEGEVEEKRIGRSGRVNLTMNREGMMLNKGVR